MSELVKYAGGGLTARERRMGRNLARIDDQTDFGLAKIDQAAQWQVGKVRAVGHVGKQALYEVSQVSQLENQLVGLIPTATPRLQGIGDMVALAVAEVVSDTLHEVSRCCR